MDDRQLLLHLGGDAGAGLADVDLTGYDEATAVYSDTGTFSSASSVTGPFPGFPVPLEGDDVSDLIEEHRAVNDGHCRCGADGLPDHSRHVAEQIANGLGLRQERLDEVRNEIRYVSAWFDDELTKLEGAE